MWSRRDFLKFMFVTGGLLITQTKDASGITKRNLSVNPRGTIYRSVNGTPEGNLSKIIEMMGGIGKLIGSDDVVLIKPNVQWWNQGAPNLSAIYTFVDLIMNRPGGFGGEVVLMENCHRGPSPWNSMESGWVPRFERNSDVKDVGNFNELCSLLKRKYAKKLSVRHLIDVGAGGRRVFRPQDGSGYVYCDGLNGIQQITCENGEKGQKRRVTIMTYPIVNTDRGTIVDLKNGIWERGAYTGQPLRLINFSALNYHSTYCGMTSAIKNYMGITDLSGGSDPDNGGRLTESYFNFHSFPFNKWSPGPVPGMLGAAIGTFMKTIRKADLNITTAEWVGISSRTDPVAAHTRTVLACEDPVALDYHSAKYLLFPNSDLSIHNPDNKKGPVYHDINKCSEAGGGILDENEIEVRAFDFRTNRLQHAEELVVKGRKEWGNRGKPILKYLILRCRQIFLD
jgi:hypothetical protein